MALVVCVHTKPADCGAGKQLRLPRTETKSQVSASGSQGGPHAPHVPLAASEHSEPSGQVGYAGPQPQNG